MNITMDIRILVQNAKVQNTNSTGNKMITRIPIMFKFNITAILLHSDRSAPGNFGNILVMSTAVINSSVVTNLFIEIV